MESIESIASKAKLPGYADLSTDKLSSFKEWLEQPDIEPWLIVLDNADTERVFFERRQSNTTSGNTKRPFDFLPRHERGQILVTTRDNSLGFKLCDNRCPIKVGAFSSQEVCRSCNVHYADPCSI